MQYCIEVENNSRIQIWTCCRNYERTGAKQFHYHHLATGDYCRIHTAYKFNLKSLPWYFTCAWIIGQSVDRNSIKTWRRFIAWSILPIYFELRYPVWHLPCSLPWGCNGDPSLYLHAIPSSQLMITWVYLHSPYGCCIEEIFYHLTFETNITKANLHFTAIYAFHFQTIWLCYVHLSSDKKVVDLNVVHSTLILPQPCISILVLKRRCLPMLNRQLTAIHL